MGNSVPVPADSELDHIHEVDPTLPELGRDHGAPISTTSQTKVILKEKLFSWSGDAFKIKHEDGSTFGNELHFKSKVFSLRDNLVLVDGVSDKAVCVAKSMFVASCSEIFHIYTTAPVYHGQEKSAQKHNDQELYTYAIVERSPCSTEQAVHLTKDNMKFAYTIHRSDKWWPKNRVVRKNGLTCALMSGGNWNFDGNSFKITVNPGIDACLMLMLCAICDEMDENQQ